MFSHSSVAKQIAHWKANRHAVILAHHYQDPEIQELADFVGDTMELAQAAQNLEADVIAFCGVKFMAETAKVLNPNRTVLLPEFKAGCSLVDSCPAEAIRLFKQRNPHHAIVAYINSSVEAKAESHLVCTSRNAVAVVNSIPSATPILFVPDSNLGNWVKKQTGRRNMQIWQGACIVHATFPARRLVSVRAEHPDALVAAHPGCPADVLRMADFIGSASAIVDWCARQNAEEYIVVTESGVRYSLEKNSPGKRFYFVLNETCNCSECPYMRMNTQEKLLACLQTLSPSIQLEEDLIARARLPLERMLQYT
jgi:quinolinate synthase